MKEKRKVKTPQKILNFNLIRYIQVLNLQSYVDDNKIINNYYEKYRIYFKLFQKYCF